MERSVAFLRAATGLSLVTIGVQIGIPLLHGPARQIATGTVVVTFAAASVTHAAGRTGRSAAGRLLLVAGGLGLVTEAVGVATGFPFGTYRYNASLGPRVLGVPLLVPLAWTMMAYPCLLLGRRLAGSARTRSSVLHGAAALAAWDLFLDPQMVAEGHWTWRHPTPALPGIPGVPLTNDAGWILVALLMIAVLDHVLPPTGADGDETAPALLLGWTWIGGIVGNAVFFDRPIVACYGAVAMGATVLPYLIALIMTSPAAIGRSPSRRTAVAS